MGGKEGEGREQEGEDGHLNRAENMAGSRCRRRVEPQEVCLLEWLSLSC